MTSVRTATTLVCLRLPVSYKCPASFMVKAVFPLFGVPHTAMILPIGVLLRSGFRRVGRKIIFLHLQVLFGDCLIPSAYKRKMQGRCGIQASKQLCLIGRGKQCDRDRLCCVGFPVAVHRITGCGRNDLYIPEFGRHMGLIRLPVE